MYNNNAVILEKRKCLFLLKYPLYAGQRSFFMSLATLKKHFIYDTKTPCTDFIKTSFKLIFIM